MLPVTTITFAMTTDMEIHTLRHLALDLNGTKTYITLSYTALSSSKSYNVSGRYIDGKKFNESYWTQDEAEQEYIICAGYVMGAATQMLKLQEDQLTELQRHLNGERAPLDFEARLKQAAADLERDTELGRPQY